MSSEPTSSSAQDSNETPNEAATSWQIASSKNQKTLKPKKGTTKKKEKPVPADVIQHLVNDAFNTENVETVQKFVDDGQKVVVIMRGCPGSGKTFLANQIKFTGVIVSADSYFLNDRGVYVYNALKLTDAHIFCRTKVTEAIKNKISPIIIDNTNLKGWEFKAYAKMAYLNDYHVELMEPNTPWKYKASQLATKNTHSVPFNKIQKLLIDFEKNIDVKLLAGSCVKPNTKPGTFIRNFDQYLNEPNSDWNGYKPIVTPLDNSKKDIPVEKDIDSLFAVHSRTSSASSGGTKSTSPFSFLNDQKSDAVDWVKINESRDLLRAMFSDVDDDILVEFLVKYNNDVTVVTNILLDSLNLSEFSRQTDTPLQVEEMPVKSCPKLNLMVDSLRELCIREMDKQEENVNLKGLNGCEDGELNRSLGEKSVVEHGNQARVKHSSSFGCLTSKPRNNHNLFKPTFIEPKSFASSNSSSTSSGNHEISNHKIPLSSSPTNSVHSFSTQFSRSDSGSYSMADLMNQTTINKEVIANERTNFDDEPILKLDLNQDFLSSLITLFGDASDEAALAKNTQNIQIGIKMAYQLYISWKQTNTTTNPDHFHPPNPDNNNKMSQIEEDEKLSKQLFDQINMRDPILKQPAFLSDKGINSAQSSLRQIMAEEMADQIKLERIAAKIPKSNVPVVPVVDFTKVLQTSTNQPTKFNIKTFSRRDNNKENGFGRGTTDYYNASSDCGGNGDENSQRAEYRWVANKYFNLRADYFRKAGEAFKRGWGGVAQYYAEMGHEQTLNMQQSNEIASIQTFINNNPDIQNSNTLDLHGLQVKEALNVLKQVMAEKRSELLAINGKKLKTYLFVITGFGHNSLNGPRLRPNVINYLVQTGLRYKEPNIGLLRIDLL